MPKSSSIVKEVKNSSLAKSNQKSSREVTSSNSSRNPSKTITKYVNIDEEDKEQKIIQDTQNYIN